MLVIKQFHTPQGMIERALTAQECIEFGELPARPFYAVVSAYNPDAEKPLEVTMTWLDYVFTFNCSVTQYLRDQLEKNKVVVGDVVIVLFVDHEYSKPLASLEVFTT